MKRPQNRIKAIKISRKISSSFFWKKSTTKMYALLMYSSKFGNFRNAVKKGDIKHHFNGISFPSIIYIS